MLDIDLVIPWVDGSDPAWQEDRNKYIKFKNTNSSFFQDWGWMKYWFRCVEENLPWIRYVFFVTYGHIPKWLNINNPKLKIVKHTDYMPVEFLPTFCSTPISINVHRIKELSETFIYAEDDIFFIGKQSPEDFFTSNGIPKDFLWFKPITEQYHGDYAHIMLNNVQMINNNITIKQITEGKEDLIFSTNYPDKVIHDNKLFVEYTNFPGFKGTHMAYSLLKSKMEEMWRLEEKRLYAASMHKFRTISDPTIALFRDWQLAKGVFSPFYPQGRIFTDTFDENLENLIMDKNTKMLCVNESSKQGYTDERSAEICSYFEKRFPKPSAFEF